MAFNKPGCSKDPDPDIDIIVIDDESDGDDIAVDRVLRIIPEADPIFIQLELLKETRINGRSESEAVQAIIKKMLRSRARSRFRKVVFPSILERENAKEVNLDFVQELLPDADKEYLRKKVWELNEDELGEFVLEALERKNYPISKEFEQKRHISAQVKQYTSEFSVEEFLRLKPPLETFQNAEREIKLDKNDVLYVKLFFKDLFRRLYWKEISKTVERNEGKIYKSVIELRSSTKLLKSKRPAPKSQDTVCQNIPLLQQLAFIKHEDEISAFLKKEKEQKEIELSEAKKAGLTLTCNCCFDEDVMPNDSGSCPNGCQFCKSCITKSVEVAFGEGKLDFKCIGGCETFFLFNLLQNILPPNLFSKIAQKKAVAEIKMAGLEDLEFCPFCDYATIMNVSLETHKIFVCRNPECFKESCRLCRKISHIPLDCDQVEEDDEVRRRVFIENKMTEALLRKCWKCGINFYKTEGCNRMTCSCGASMCYICQEPVDSYAHFNKAGEDSVLCPLYSDTVDLNRKNVKEAGNLAKHELGLTENSFMKCDPMANIDNFFKSKPSSSAQPPAPAGGYRAMGVMPQRERIRRYGAGVLGRIRYERRRGLFAPVNENPEGEHQG